jgi:electron transfer flavoprotein beta subunit
VSLGPKAKLQQVMMTWPRRRPSSWWCWTDRRAASPTPPRRPLAGHQAIPGLDKGRLLLFGGWESASRGAGATLQMIGEVARHRRAVPGRGQLTVGADGTCHPGARSKAASYQVSSCAGAPAVLGWATGSLPEPPNNPQVGMQNMRAVMPALQKAKKEVPVEEIAQEIVAWIKA